MLPCARADFVPRALRHPAGRALGLVALLLLVSTGLASADDRIRGHLAAGEFGPALDVARGLTDPASRTAALRDIGAAQLAAGDREGARATARLQPQREERARRGGETVGGRSGSGGASVADFTELIDLIQSTVDPSSWEALGGVGSVRPYNTGVFVDPQGQLRLATRQENSGGLSELARQARVADVSSDMAEKVPLRMVALRRLERAVTARLQAGESVPETMRRLAGITRIQYVFLIPDEHEIVIAGPAEGWRYAGDGRVLGVESGAPLLHLDDLVVLLRALASGNEVNFGCSINTRDENLKKLKEFVEVSNRSGPLRPGQLKKWLKELHDRLGWQDVVVHGVPADTHVARVLVEADYRMKLIGVGQVDGGDSIPSYFELLRKNRAARGLPLEALRWWLTMRYDSVVHNPERTAFEFQGGAVQVQSENQFVNSQGQHVPTGIAEPINLAFAENFTRNYDELARHDLVFADLRNVFDLALVAALLREEHWLERSQWDLGGFAPHGAYQPAVVPAPRVVDSVIAHKVFGKTEIVVQVAGGVQLDVKEALTARAAPAVERQPALPKLPVGRWWWNLSGQ